MPSLWRNDRTGFYSRLAVGYYLPILLIWTGILPFAWRYPILLVVFLGLAAYAVQRRHTARQLGFRRDTLCGSLMLNGLVTVIGVTMLLALVKLGVLHPLDPRALGWWYAFYVFFSSPVQEFLFRSLIVADMRAAHIRDNREIVIVSALTFAAVHIVYGKPVTTLATLLIGLIWGAIYARFPNWWGVTLSHIVLGAAAILAGLIV